jgi:hypothetical protein
MEDLISKFNFPKGTKKYFRTKVITSVVLAAFVGLPTPAHAILITINAIAPSQDVLNASNIPVSEATDFCIGADGDGMNFSGFGSDIVDDYNITPSFGFVSSQEISGGAIGFASSMIPEPPLSSNNEGNCFYFPEDPVDPGELFSEVIDVPFLDGAFVDEASIALLSGLDTFDCLFSYHDNIDMEDYYAPGACGVTLAPPTMLAVQPASAKLIQDDGDVRRYSVVPSPSTITLLLLGGLFMRFSPGKAKEGNKRS